MSNDNTKRVSPYWGPRVYIESVTETEDPTFELNEDHLEDERIRQSEWDVGRGGGLQQMKRGVFGQGKWKLFCCSWTDQDIKDSIDKREWTLLRVVVN